MSETQAQTPPGNWFDRLPPTVRAFIVAVAVTGLNALLGWAWGHVAPGATPPTIPTPPPAVVQAFTTAQPAPSQPVAVSKP